MSSEGVNMCLKVTSLLCLFVASTTFGQEDSKNLPVLFQFSQPSHNVAVFRGADLRKAIAAGKVKGFGSLRQGKALLTANTAPTLVHSPAAVRTLAPAASVSYRPATTQVVYQQPKPQVVYQQPQPQVVYQPAPTRVVYRPAPAPVVYKPAPAPVVYKPAPAPVVYKPAPAPVVYRPAPAPVVVKPATVSYKPAPAVSYQPYVDPYPAEEALYTYTYGVKDDYTSNDFGTQEARDGVLTNGKYSVALPDGRIQTVTYTVNGGEGYVADVQYTGVPQYPPVAAPTYSS